MENAADFLKIYAVKIIACNLSDNVVNFYCCVIMVVLCYLCIKNT